MNMAYFRAIQNAKGSSSKRKLSLNSIKKNSKKL